MTTLTEPCRHRGQYRFWQPIDYRYKFYSWPTLIIARCRDCGGRVAFEAIVPEPHIKDKESGGYSLVIQPIATEILGRGACSKCGRQFNKILWPEDAYYQFSVSGGNVWAWNEKYLYVLRAHVAGDRVRERKLCLEDGLYRYFLSRIPKHVVVKRHRDRILHKLDDFIAKSRITLRSSRDAQKRVAP